MVVYLVWTAGGYVSGDSGECRAATSYRSNWYGSWSEASAVAARVGGQVVGWRSLPSGDDGYGLPTA